YVGAGEHDAAAIWPNESDDHIKGRCLASAVRPEQADDFAGASVDVDSVDDRAAAINFHERVGGKDVVDLRCRRSRHLRYRTRSSLTDHGVADSVGEDAGFFSFFSSSPFGSWRISVRLGPCVVNC